MTFDPRKANVSEAFRRRNPHLFGVGGLGAGQPQSHQGPALVQDPQAREASGEGVASGSARVTFCFFTHRILDDDNYVGGMKPLRDAIARWIGIDDGDPRLVWKYHQIPTAGRCGVSTTIETT